MSPSEPLSHQRDELLERDRSQCCIQQRLSITQNSDRLYPSIGARELSVVQRVLAPGAFARRDARDGAFLDQGGLLALASAEVGFVCELGTGNVTSHVTSDGSPAGARSDDLGLAARVSCVREWFSASCFLALLRSFATHAMPTTNEDEKASSSHCSSYKHPCCSYEMDPQQPEQERRLDPASRNWEARLTELSLEQPAALERLQAMRQQIEHERVPSVWNHQPRSSLGSLGLYASRRLEPQQQDASTLSPQGSAASVFELVLQQRAAPQAKSAAQAPGGAALAWSDPRTEPLSMAQMHQLQAAQSMTLASADRSSPYASVPSLFDLGLQRTTVSAVPPMERKPAALPHASVIMELLQGRTGDAPTIAMMSNRIKAPSFSQAPFGPGALPPAIQGDLSQATHFKPEACINTPPSISSILAQIQSMDRPPSAVTRGQAQPMSTSILAVLQGMARAASLQVGDAPGGVAMLPPPRLNQEEPEEAAKPPPPRLNKEEPAKAAKPPPKAGLPDAFTFPIRLHRLIVAAEAENRRDIIHFSKAGDSFVLVDRDALMSDLVPRFFRLRSFASFRRQMCLYDFEKDVRSANQTEYRHPLFHRDRPEDLVKLLRKDSSR